MILYFDYFQPSSAASFVLFSIYAPKTSSFLIKSSLPQQIGVSPYSQLLIYEITLVSVVPTKGWE